MKKLKPNPGNIFAILLVLSGIMSCSIGTRPQKTDTGTESDITRPQILFLNYSISKNKINGDYQIRLQSKIIRDGSLKEPGTKSMIPMPDDLGYIVLNDKSQVMSRTYIGNPLKISLEYVNEDGQLARKEVELDSTQFSIRLQLDPIAKFIALERYLGKGTKNIPLIITNL